jgi:hypothetical protein
MASAVVLTNQFGEAFIYQDTIISHYGPTPRNYHSFIEAAEEVSESRILGGIHYRMAVEDGMGQGELLGERLVEFFRVLQ